MPGICGILSRRPQPQSEEDLDLMVRALRHEPFHKLGKYTNAEIGLYAGWASVEGTFSAAMPVWNEKKTCLLIFYGRHFCDKEDVTALKSRNHVIRKQDASLVIHLYEEKGPDFLRDLNGLYSGLLLDLDRKKGFVFNDRFGLQRVYYHQSQDAFYFASEAKSLIRALPELSAVSLESVGQLVCCNGVLDNRTLFDRISLLPPGSRWSFEAGRIAERGLYFSAAEWEEQTLLGEDYFCGRIRETLERIVPRYFRSENPCAMALSGGVGARLIAGSTELPRGKVPCYTFEGMYRQSLDARCANTLSKTLSQAHHLLRLDGEFIERFAEFAENAVYLSDGTALVSAAAELYLAHRVRQIAPVSIAGRFVAQTLKGTRQLRPTLPEAMLFQPEIESAFAELQGRFRTPPRHPLSAALFEELPWLHHGRLAVEQSQLELCTPFLDKDFIGLLFRAPDGAIRGERLPLSLLKHSPDSMAPLLADIGYKRTRHGVTRSWKATFLSFLRHADRVYSGTAPSPRNRVVLRIPGLEKASIGYDTYAHFRIWYRHQLAAYAKDLLLDPRSLARPYLRPGRVEQILQHHTSGSADYTREISLLLTLELVYRLFVDDAGSRLQQSCPATREPALATLR